MSKKDKGSGLLGALLGIGAGGLAVWALWPKEAEASTEPLGRAQQTMDTRELPPTPAPKPAVVKPSPAKKSAPKKPAAKAATVDEQLMAMRAAAQAFEMERDPAGAAAMRKQIAQVLNAEIQKADIERNLTRAAALREQLAALQTTVGEERFEFEQSSALSAADDLIAQAQAAADAGNLDKVREIREQLTALFPDMFPDSGS
jgi:hypothetical protein